MTVNSFAPVCMFVFKRPDTLKDTITSLQKNAMALHTDIHIFSDAATKEQDKENVRKVRDFIGSITGFKSVSIYLAEKNNGLAQSIINGVTRIIDASGKVIVLEDDLVVAPNFLSFMNQALVAYENNPRIFSISGYTSPVAVKASQDAYFTGRGSSWGWATWKNRWEKIDFTVTDFDAFSKNIHLQREFNKMGSDLTHMLKKQMEGKISSWAIRWVYHQFKFNLLTVFPVISKVSNNGFHPDATHTEKVNASRFATVLDQSAQLEFNFPTQPALDKNILRQFVAPYTIKTRVLYKIKALLHKI